MIKNISLKQEDTLHYLFEKNLNNYKNKTAIVYNNNSISYEDLNKKSNQLARILRGRGLSVEDSVALCIDRSIEMVICMLAIIKCGCAYVPIHPKFPNERISYMIKASGAKFTLTTSNYKHKFLVEEVIALEDIEGTLHNNSEENLEIGVHKKNKCYVMFTSGTTGNPKGVINVHEGIVNQIKWLMEQFPFTPEAKVLNKAAFSFDCSVVEVFWPLASGAELHISSEFMQDDFILAEYIYENNITDLYFTPSRLTSFLEQPNAARCKSIKRVYSAGEALSVKLARSFKKNFLNTQLYNLYGPTECSVQVTSHEYKLENNNVFLGKPSFNTAIYILDENLNHVAPGEKGDIYIGGVQVSRGYTDSVKTANNFIPDLYATSPGMRMYRTGDVANYTINKEIEYIGRKDNQLKVRGFRIEPGEIESKLKEYQGIKNALVLNHTKHGNERLVAFIEVTDKNINTNNIRGFLKEGLPHFMIPGLFIKVENFPLNNNGKIDKKQLLDIDLNKNFSEELYEEPKNKKEEEVLTIWSGVFKNTKIGVNDNFFELGGDSFAATKLVFQMKEKGFKLSIVDLFEYQTIRKLSENIEYTELPKNGSASKKNYKLLSMNNLDKDLLSQILNKID